MKKANSQLMGGQVKVAQGRDLVGIKRDVVSLS